LIQPTAQPPGGFDFTTSTIAIGDFGSTTGTLTADRSSSPLPSPQPATDSDWTDLRFVASVKDRYQSTKLRSNWLEKVSGRLKLTRGVLKAVHPTDVYMKKGVWEFRGGADAPMPFYQAMTNATEYTVDVPGDQIVLTLTNAASSASQIIVK